MNLVEEIGKLRDKQDFIVFLQILIKNLKENPDEWENRTLESFLGAIADWVEDMEGYYLNNNLPIPDRIDWKFFANILAAARVYE